MFPFLSGNKTHLPNAIGRLLKLAFVAILLLAFLFAFRHVLLGTYIKKLIVEQVDARLGLDISVAVVNGTYFSSLELSDVKTLGGSPKTILTSVEAGRIVFHYSLPSLLAGVDSFLAQTSIGLERADVQLDIPSKTNDQRGLAEDAAFLLPAVLPHISVRNGSVGVNTQQGRFEFNGLTVITEDIKKKQTDSYLFQVMTEQAFLPVPALKKGPLAVTVFVHYTPKAVSLSALRIDKETIADSIDLDLANYSIGRLPFKADLHLYDGSIRLKGIVDKSTVVAGLEISRVNLAIPPSFLAKSELPFAGILTGRADMSVDLGDPINSRGDLALNLEKGRVDGIAVDQAMLAASAVDGFLSVQRFDVQLEDNTFSLRDAGFAVRPLLKGDLKGLLADAEGEFTLNANAIPRVLALAGYTDGLVADKDKFPAHNLRIAGRLQKGSLVFTEGKLNIDTSSIVVDSGSITLPPPGSSFAKATLQSNLTFRVGNLEQIAELFSLPSMAGSLQGKIILSGTIVDLNGSATLEGEDLAVADWQLGSIRTKAKVTAGSIIMDPLTIEQGGNKAGGSGLFRIADQYIENMHLALTVSDPKSFAVNIFSNILPLQGKIIADVKVKGPLLEPEIDVEARMANGRYDGIDISTCDVSLINKGLLLTVRKARMLSPEGEVNLAGTLRRDMENREFDIGLEMLKARREQAEMELVSPASLAIKKTGGIHVDHLILNGNIGRIEADGELQKSGSSDFKVIFTGLTDKGWFDVLAGDRLYFNGADAILQIRGDLQSPAVALEGTIEEIGNRQAPFPFTGSFKLNYAEQQLHVHRFSFSGSEGRGTAEISGRLPFNPLGERLFPKKGGLDLAARFQLPDLKMISEMLPPYSVIKGKMNGNILLQGTWEEPTGLVRLEAEDVMLPADWKFIPQTPFNLNCDINLAEEQFSFAPLRLDSQPVSFTVTGKWLNPPSLGNMLNNQVSLKTGSLDMKGKLAMTEIGWLAKDIEAIRRLDGQLTVEASLTGSINDPAVVGTLRLSDGELRPSYEMPSIGEMNMDAVVDPEQIVISKFQGEFGGAPFTAVGKVTGYRDADTRADFILKGENLLVYRNEGMKVRSDADIKIRGPLAKLDISGDLAITDGRFTRNFDFLSLFRRTRETGNGLTMQPFSFREPPLNKAVFQVRVAAKTPFRIKNNLANGSVRPDFLLAGTGELPVIQGNIYLDPTKIKVPSGTINLESGLVHFPENDPDRPQLDITGKARILGYEITILVHGPLDEPTVTLSSSPPLPDDELLLLLITGKAPKTTGNGRARKSGMNIALYLGRDVLAKWFEAGDAESDESILDRFELEIGRGVTRLGEQTIEGQFRLAEGTFQKDDILFITAEKDIYDAFNAGLKIVFRFQ